MDDETIKQSAKAVRAVAKTTNTAIEAGRDVGGWLNKVFGKAIVDTVGLVWTDRVAARRIEAAIFDWKRLQQLFRAVDAQLKRNGTKRTRRVPPKIALPLLEHASMETSRQLQRLWANLLTTALTPKGEQIHRAYVTILGELTGEDARALRAAYLEWKSLDKKMWNSGPVKFEPGVDAPRASIAGKLHTLGLIGPTLMVLQVYSPPRHSYRYGDEGGSVEEAAVVGELDVVKFTKFGEQFCDAIGSGKKTARGKNLNLASSFRGSDNRKTICRLEMLGRQSNRGDAKWLKSYLTRALETY
jgi:hypothetical protein